VNGIIYAPLKRSLRNFYYGQKSYVFNSLFFSANSSNIKRTTAGSNEYISGVGLGNSSRFFTSVGGDFWTTSSGKVFMDDLFNVESDRVGKGLKVGDISNANGGAFVPHGGHRIGKSFDFTTNYISGSRNVKSFNRGMLYDLEQVFKDSDESHKMDSILVSIEGSYHKRDFTYTSYINYDLSPSKGGLLSTLDTTCLGDFTGKDLLRSDRRRNHEDHLHIQIDQGKSLKSKVSNLEDISITDPSFEVVPIEEFGVIRNFQKFTYTVDPRNNGDSHFDMYIEEVNSFGLKEIIPLYEEFNSIHNTTGCVPDPENINNCEFVGVWDSDERYGPVLFEGLTRQPLKVKVLKNSTPKKVEVYIDITSEALVSKLSKIRIKQTDIVKGSYRNFIGHQVERSKCRSTNRKLEVRLCGVSGDSSSYLPGEIVNDGGFISRGSDVDSNLVSGIGRGVEICDSNVKGEGVVSLSGSIRVSGGSTIKGDVLMQAGNGVTGFMSEPMISIEDNSLLDLKIKNSGVIVSSGKLKINSGSKLSGGVDIEVYGGNVLIGRSDEQISSSNVVIDASHIDDKFLLISNSTDNENIGVAITGDTSVKNHVSIISNGSIGALDPIIIEDSSIEAGHLRIISGGAGVTTSSVGVSGGADIKRSQIKGDRIGISANFIDSQIDVPLITNDENNTSVVSINFDTTNSFIGAYLNQGVKFTNVRYNENQPCQTIEGCPMWNSIYLQSYADELSFENLSFNSLNLGYRDLTSSQFADEKCYLLFNTFVPSESGDYYSHYDNNEKKCKISKNN
jgi:hypothetical protein